MKGIEEFPSFILDSGILEQNGFFVLEHISTKSFTQIQGFTEARQYGQTVFSFFGIGS
jgi:hypothetical protein